MVHVLRDIGRLFAFGCGERLIGIFHTPRRSIARRCRSHDVTGLDEYGTFATFLAHVESAICVCTLLGSVGICCKCATGHLSAGTEPRA